MPRRDWHWVMVYIDGVFDHQEHCRCKEHLSTHEAYKHSEAAMRTMRAAYARQLKKKRKLFS